MISKGLEALIMIWRFFFLSFFFFAKCMASKSLKSWGTWVAQSVTHLTLDLSSVHDLTVCEFEPHVEKIGRASCRERVCLYV